MSGDNSKLTLPKRGVWGGYTIERIGPRSRGYYWIGEGDEYLMALTTSEAKRVSRFLIGKEKL